MSLLELEHVRLGDRESPGRLLLEDVCLELDAGEQVVVWGKRRSGRSSLLRVACGLLAADDGVVRFEGRTLCGPTAIGHGIAYCAGATQGTRAWPVQRELMEVQLARGIPRRHARVQTQQALERAGAEHLSASLLRTLRGADQVRAMLALALTGTPRLLLVDDVVAGVEVIERRGIIALLRSLADDGLGVLVCSDEAPAFASADRALTLSEGRLHGRVAPALADVVPLQRSASA